VFEPDRVVIGGGLGASAGDLFLDVAVAEAHRRALPAAIEGVRFSLAQSGPHAGVFGAGLLARMEHTPVKANPGGG
jgi:glucokinase